MNLKEKKELLEEKIKKHKWAIPIAIIEWITLIMCEVIFLVSMYLSGIMDTEVQKAIIYILIGYASTAGTNLITSNVKQKREEYEEVAVDAYLTQNKTEKVEHNVKKMTPKEKIELLYLLRDNPDMLTVASNLEELKYYGEEEFYNSILQTLNDAEKNNYQYEFNQSNNTYVSEYPKEDYGRTRKR